MQQLEDCRGLYLLFLCFPGLVGDQTPTIFYESALHQIHKDWLMFLSVYCRRYCQNGRLITPWYPNYPDITLCPNPLCFPCNCDENCSALGTCCPTIDETNSFGSYNLNSTIVPDYTKGIYSRIDCRHPPHLTTNQWHFDAPSTTYLSVATCPKNWTDEQVKEQCENPDGKTRDSIVPYIQKDSGIMFQNKYCIECNGFKSDGDMKLSRVNENPHAAFSELKLSVECYSYQRLYHITDAIEFIKTATQSGCGVDFGPNEVEPIICPSWMSSIDGAYLGNKNDSTQDVIFDRLCNDLPDIPAFRVDGYKNIFCYLKEGHDILYDVCRPGSKPNTVPFTLLWDVPQRDNSLPELVTCYAGQWKNGEDVCITPSCAAGKIYDVKGSTCNSSLSHNIPLYYTITMTMVTLDNLLPDVNKIIDFLSFNFVYCKITVSHIWNCYGKGEIDVFVEVETKARHASRDSVETKLVNKLMKNAWVIDEVSLHPVCVGAELCAFYRSEARYSCSSEIQTYTRDNLNRFLSNQGQSSIDLVPNIICPYIDFVPIGEPTVDSNNTNIYFTISLNDQEIRIKWNYNISNENGHLSLCLTYLQELSNQMDAYNPRDITSSVLLALNYYLDLVCMSVSCVLLQITVVTYLIFPSLRNTPGLNILCLCVSLLSANVSLLITTLVGTRGLLPKPYCLFHAMFLHYSWLASFVWMNTCCVHMYRVFKGHHVGSRKKSFIWYSFQSFGSPFIIVVLVIIITHTTTDGASIGYSSEICFLDTTISILIIVMGILVPLGVTVLINSALFLLTIREMFSIRKMQRQTKSSHGVWIYTKLSTVTGLFCLLSAAGAQFDSVVLSLISNPLSALQGLFVFVSFTANKRIYLMYYQMVFKKD